MRLPKTLKVKMVKIRLLWFTLKESYFWKWLIALLQSTVDRLLCKVGIHDWERIMYSVTDIFRKCRRCDKLQLFYPFYFGWSDYDKETYRLLYKDKKRIL